MNRQARYLKTIYSNGLLQIIGKATRTLGDSDSLIDHITYKCTNHVRV